MCAPVHHPTPSCTSRRLARSQTLTVQAQTLVQTGNLLPDSIIFQLMERRLRKGRAAGEQAVLLDGFPRTVKQAEALLGFSDVQLAVNLSVDLRVSTEWALIWVTDLCFSMGHHLM